MNLQALMVVLEDVTDVILNLKAVRFRQSDEENKTLQISKKRPL